MRKRLVVATFCFYNLVATAQNYPKQDIDLSHLANELFSNQDLDLNYEDLYENMVQLLANPIDLNKVGVEELRLLNVLSENQIASLLLYREENGNFLSTYELQSVPGFDLQTIYKLVPFIGIIEPSAVLDKSLIKRIFSEPNNYFITRYERTLETKKGYKDESSPGSKFLGSPDKLYLRFRASKPGDFSLGFTTEKDAGEKMIWNPAVNQYGFDYLSFHAQVQNKGKLKNLIIGDFQNQFGQGLVLGGGFGLGKGAETISTTRRSNIGSMPYTSLNESGYLRGITSTYALAKHIFLTGFFSHAKRDGTVSASTSDESIISSFQITGFHRSENELNGRKTITETNYGSVINFRNKTIDAGILFNSIMFSSSVSKTPTPYNQFAFNGDQNHNVGAFLNYSLKNFTFFSEVSQSIKAGQGLLVGLLGSLSSNLDISILYRKFDKDFYTFYSNAFSENTTPQNESGLYWGWKYRWNKQFSAAGYFDLFKFPWVRFRSYNPSTGYEWLGKLTYQPSKNIVLYIQFREESKVRNTGNDANLFITGVGLKRNYRMNCDYNINPKIKMKTRAQFSSYQLDHHTTSGMAVMQDLSIKLGRVEITGRYALFDTDDYDNRQYVYEQDVWLAYSLPPYYGTGVRNLILIEYKMNRNISLWLRYARTRYTNNEEIGTGADAIAGNTRNDVKVQLRLRL